MTLAVIKKILRLEYIVIYLVVSGFLAANLAWVVHYFTSPSTRSSTTELYAELAYIHQQRQNSTEDTYVITEREKDMQDWRNLWRKELELREAIKNAYR